MMASEEYCVKINDYVDVFIKRSTKSKRVSKQLIGGAAACLRARRCADVPMLRGLT
jgi:hypothetical protein